MVYRILLWERLKTYLGVFPKIGLLTHFLIIKNVKIVNTIQMTINLYHKLFTEITIGISQSPISDVNAYDL